MVDPLSLEVELVLNIKGHKPHTLTTATVECPNTAADYYGALAEVCEYAAKSLKEDATNA